MRSAVVVILGVAVLALLGDGIAHVARPGLGPATVGMTTDRPPSAIGSVGKTTPEEQR